MGYPSRLPLIKASVNGHAGIVKMLLAEDVDVNQRNMDDHTSLAEASWKGHAQVVKMLLAKGADPNLPDYEGGAALYLG